MTLTPGEKVWQPISTAPTDGTEVITARRHGRNKPWQVSVDSYIVNGPHDLGWLIGTEFWQPLPAPPRGGKV